jgi:S-formylglutathione hydrolase FrmB
MGTVATVEFMSAALQRQVTYTALTPDAGEPPFAVLYLLHGYTDDHHAWLHRSNLLRYVEALPLLVILPSAENSYYADHPPLRLFEQLIVRDLPAHVQRTFHVRSGKAAIGGLSMGGFGAIRLGLKYPELYTSIYAHSSRLAMRAELPTLPWARGLDDAALDDLDIDGLVARLDPATLPALAFDCGTEDHLLGDSRRFDQLLRGRGLAHQYTEYPGAHTWDYWDARLPAALRHHAAALGLSS